MKLFKNGEEYCSAQILERLWFVSRTNNPHDRELRYVLVVDKDVQPPALNEIPKPVWEYDDGRRREKVGIRRGTVGEDMMVVVGILKEAKKDLTTPAVTTPAAQKSR